MTDDRGAGTGGLARVGLAAGPVVAGIVYLVLPQELGVPGRSAAALALWMAIWWLSEAIPIAATALLPLAVLPLSGRSAGDVAAPYGHPFIFLFLGGFLVALSMERWNLHRRVALHTLRLVGTRPKAIVAGFMVVTAMLSMWMSNTATAVMMLPIALSVVELGSSHSRQSQSREPGDPGLHSSDFAICLLLAIAYSASIGGIGTIVGTPPNLFLVSYVRDTTGLEIGFARWMLIGLPLVAIMLPLTWWLLTYVLYPLRHEELSGGRRLLSQQLGELGPVSRGEWNTLAVFLLLAVGWMTRPLLMEVEVGGVRPFASLTDTGLAIGAALLLFAIPAGSDGVATMDWETAKRVPWGILLLFGGGLSLARALQDTGVTDLLGQQVSGLEGMPAPVVIVVVTALVVFLTEITSNTATTAALVPLLAAVAPGLGLHTYTLIVPAAIAASCAFMMPVATPPNAVVFGSGHIRVHHMARAGLWLNLISVCVVTALTWFVVLPLLIVD